MTNEVKYIRVDPAWAGTGSALSFDSAEIAAGIDTARYFAWVVPNNPKNRWQCQLACGNGAELSASFLRLGALPLVIVVR